MTCTVRKPTKESSSKLSTKEEQRDERNVTLKSESLGNLLIRSIQCFKLSNRENVIMTRLLTLEKKALIKRRFCYIFLWPVSSFSQLPAQLPCWVVREPSAQKCLTSFGLAMLNLCPGKLLDRGLNKREIRFNSCHFGGLQSSQGSCRALKAVVTLREAGSWGYRMGCVCVHVCMGVAGVVLTDI